MCEVLLVHVILLIKNSAITICNVNILRMSSGKGTCTTELAEGVRGLSRSVHKTQDLTDFCTHRKIPHTQMVSIALGLHPRAINTIFGLVIFPQA